MTFTYIDGIFLGILVLVTLDRCICGFLKSVLAFCGTLVKLVISFFLCKPVATLISNWTQADENLKSRFFDWASGLSEKFNINLVGMNDADLSSHINRALSDASFPRILRGIFRNVFQITPDVIAGQESVTMADLISITLSQFVLTAICFVAIFLILFIVIFIIKRISRRVFEKNKFFFKADKVLGAVVGLVEGMFVALILLSVLSIFKNSNLFANFFNTLDKSVIAKPISELMFKLIDNYFDFNGSLIDVFKKS